jgi:hypothetical protein
VRSRSSLSYGVEFAASSPCFAWWRINSQSGTDAPDMSLTREILARIRNAVSFRQQPAVRGGLSRLANLAIKFDNRQREGERRPHANIVG